MESTITSTLVIFCKKPKLHQGKQRLVEDISANSALQIAQALLACAIEDANGWQGAVVIACSDNSDIPWAQTLMPKALVITQLPEGRAGNLGQRLNYVDEQLRLLGYRELIFIGTDAPVLNAKHYSAVLSSLENHDVALSQADDGGVVIMANKKPWPVLTNLPWSTNRLSRALSQLCWEQHLVVDYTLPAYDIDYVADIKKLSVDLKADVRPARIALLNKIETLFLSE